MSLQTEPTAAANEATADRRHWRLRRRVFGSLLLLGVALAPVLLISLWLAALVLEDATFERQLELETERLLEARRTGAPAIAARFFEAYWSFEEIPAAYDDWLGGVLPMEEIPLRELGPGLFESAVSDVHVAIVPLSDRSSPWAIRGPAPGSCAAGCLYVFYNVSSLEPLEGTELHYFGTAAIVFLTALVVLSMALAQWLDRQVLLPLRELAEAADRWDLDDWLHRPLPTDRRRDEIGSLTRATRAAARRIHAFAARERDFTRNASHELRSPLTVIRGATELLRARTEHDAALERPLERIERATRRMESTIETFLWLAREEQQPPGVAAPVRPALDDCLDQLPRRPDREHSLEIDIAPDLALPVSAEALRIVLDNLLGNALRHGASGIVVLTADTDHIAVTNPLAAPLEDPETLRRPFVGEGSGLGLAIVEELCSRYEWSLTLEPLTAPDGAPQLRVAVRFR
ncbi:MAG: HAMP domain-containing sensor histidine kinase [Acidobacteriota bacterium]